MAGGRLGDRGGVFNDGRMLISLHWAIPRSAPVSTGVLSHPGC